MVEKSADISFLFAFLMVLKRVFIVLIVPLCLALLTRRYLPHVAQWIRDRRNLGFYLWSFNLSIIMGLAMQSILHAPVSGITLVALCVIPLFISVFQFGLGKARRRALWRQHQCRTSLRTEEYGGGHLAHADLSQPLRRHRTLRLCGMAKPHQCRTTLGKGEIRSAEVVKKILTSRQLRLLELLFYRLG